MLETEFIEKSDITMKPRKFTHDYEGTEYDSDKKGKTEQIVLNGKGGRVNWTKVAVGSAVGLVLGAATSGTYVLAKNETVDAVTDGEDAVDDGETLVATVVESGEGTSAEPEAMPEIAASAASVTASAVSAASTTATVSTSGAHPVWTDGEIPVAGSVNDGMSFGNAFAAARAEVGSPGVFEWRGQIYSTFTAEEWDGMTVAEKTEYGSHFNYASDGHTVVEDMADTDTQDDDLEVEVLGVVHDNETGANVGGMVIGGETAVLIDIDDDHTFDYAVIDANHDEKISEDEVIDISDGNITVEELGGISDIADDLFAAGNDDNLDDGGILL